MYCLQGLMMPQTNTLILPALGKPHILVVYYLVSSFECWIATDN
jgi:hypothetical protein